MSRTKTILLARHFETDKNVANIHGLSSLARITRMGRAQAQRLADVIRVEFPRSVDGVVASPTRQAVASARLVADLVDVPYLGRIGLAPVGLGVGDGRSNAELAAEDLDSFRSLDAFRARAISAAELRVRGSEPVDKIEARLSAWWSTEGQRLCPNRLVVGTNSTVLMIAHLLNGVPPSSPSYRFLPTPNGTCRAWRLVDCQWTADSPFAERHWPEIEQHGLPSDYGPVAVSRHLPSWMPRKTAIAIVPGYFGSSRHGPYGLYSRLARRWAWEGYETVTVDPLGTGDSSSVFRDFSAETHSVETVCRWLLRRHDRLLVVGHSMGAATALAVRARLRDVKCTVWSIAPLCRLADLSRRFFTVQQSDELRNTGHTRRHGLELRLDMILAAEAAWDAYHHSVDSVWLPCADLYTAGSKLPDVPPDRIHQIAGADHNFAADDSADLLSDATVRELGEHHA